MYLKRLEIKGFGRLRNLNLDLNQGLNIIYGINESGKTSIQSFIKAVFFGLKGGRAGKEGLLSPAKRFRPWVGDEFSGFILYCLEDGREFRAGRNFENNSVRVFDSTFNEITNDFDISRERGALFAEKHLGMNEICFEKTLFIKQMETRIGDDGSKELLSRLMNVAQTGFEDISFVRAQEALKEALKIYVGNDKTTTRPFDKVINRLQELILLKTNMSKKRDTGISIEKEMINAMSHKDNLEERKVALIKVREIIETMLVLEKNRKLKDQLDSELNKMTIKEEELDVLKKRSLDFQRTREELVNFSEFTENDLDNISIEYNKLISLEAEMGKLGEEISGKKDDVQRVEKEAEPFRAYGQINFDTPNELLSIYKETETLKELVNGKFKGLIAKSEGLKKKNKSLGNCIFLSIVLTCIFITVSFLNRGNTIGIASLIASVTGLAVILTLIINRSRVNRELSHIIEEQVNNNENPININEEFLKKQGILKDTLEVVGAPSIEDFIRSKAQYDNKLQIESILNTQLSALQIRNAACKTEHESIRASIMAKLLKAGILESDKNKIDSGDITDFKNSIRKYTGQLPSLNYTLQRIEDMDNDLKSGYRFLTSLTGIESISKSKYKEFAEKLTAQIQIDENIISESIGEMKKLHSKGLSDSEAYMLGKILNTKDLGSLDTGFEFELNKVTEELNSLLIQIREYEVMLKEISSNSIELQKIEEEYSEIEVRKNNLEDINISLKLALEVLTEASIEIQKDFAPSLNTKMSSIINKITSGRYKDLRADNSLTLKTITPETGNVTSAATLSGGTIDQMYLALRISMADLISGHNETLPLIMDEVFSQYDDERTRETFEYLNEISLNRQIIFLTCKCREVEIAKAVCGEKVNVINL